jgi:hypothetical protein
MDFVDPRFLDEFKAVAARAGQSDLLNKLLHQMKHSTITGSSGSVASASLETPPAKRKRDDSDGGSDDEECARLAKDLMTNATCREVFTPSLQCVVRRFWLSLLFLPQSHLWWHWRWQEA